MRRTLILALACFALSPAFAGHGSTGQTNVGRSLRIAAAADLRYAFEELRVKFEKKTGIDIVLTYGSSGDFYSQLAEGAPFDLFFSADLEYAKKLDAQQLTEPGSLDRYAIGRIVLWIPENSPIDVARLQMNALLDPSVRKIAVANPEHAPYGRAAVAAIKHSGLYEKISDKFVFGENISQTAQFVESGNAQIGVIALSLAVAPAMQGKGAYWKIPGDFYEPIQQGAVIMKSSPNKASARAFLDFLQSADGKEAMRRYGFEIPGDSPKSAE
ncbi:MAG: molybdate ABC transporter substrate-binding protein [Candidatus Acidiferrales bacterium]